MEFQSVLIRARALTGSTIEGVNKLLQEFNESLPAMRALGFSVEDVQVTMGLLPEVSVRLTAAADDVNARVLEEMIWKTGEQKSLVAVLKALQTAYSIRNRLGDLGLNGVEINMTLGTPPKVSVGFLKPSLVVASNIAKTVE